MNLQLGKVNSFLYGILITVCIIMMIFYIIWLIKEVLELEDINVKEKAKTFKDKATEKWYQFRNYAKGVCDR